MPKFEETHKETILFSYSSFDRIILNGYIPLLQTEGAVAFFLRKRGTPILSPVVFKKLTDQYVTRVEAFSRGINVPILKVPTESKPGDFAQKFLQEAEKKDRWGIVAILVNQERCRSFTSIRISKEHAVFDVCSKARAVNHYYFYIRDREFGCSFIRIGTYLPFPMRVWLNPHEWVEQSMRAQGRTCQRVGNSFMATDDPEKLQRACDAFNSETVRRFLSRWLKQIPLPLEDQDRQNGYKHNFSLYQVEYCRNHIFKDTGTLNRLFDQLIRDNMNLGRPEWLKILFDRQIRKNTPVRPEASVLRAGDVATIRLSYKSNALKQYNKGGKILRTELVINNPYDFRVNKGLVHMDYLRVIAHHATTRLLEAQAVSYHTALDRSAYERIVAPSPTNGGQRPAALRLGAPRTMALLEALCCTGLIFSGFTNSRFRERVAPLLGTNGDDYHARKAGYDLRKLAAHDIVRKARKKNVWTLTEKGYGVAQFLVKLDRRVLGPALAALEVPLPSEASKSRDPFDQALLRLDRVIEQLIRAAGLAA